jgi:hypothetical protein
LRFAYPEHKWARYNRFTFRHASYGHGSKSQEALLDVLKKFLPSTEVYSNFRLTEGRTSDLRYYEFDVFVPSLSLALEYQGQTHYFSSHTFGKASDRQRADLFKLEYANQLGITVISVPFWWDKKPASIAATINLVRPDILLYDAPTKFASPIPTAMPHKYQSQSTILNASATYDETINPVGWYTSTCMVLT